MSQLSARRNLFKKDPHCHWCGRETYLDVKMKKFADKQMATVDHIKCKAQCVSWQEYISGSNKVLACYLCNQRRNEEFLKSHNQHQATWNLPESAERKLFLEANSRANRKKTKYPPRKFGDYFGRTDEILILLTHET